MINQPAKIITHFYNSVYYVYYYTYQQFLLIIKPDQRASATPEYWNTTLVHQWQPLIPGRLRSQLYCILRSTLILAEIGVQISEYSFFLLIARKLTVQYERVQSSIASYSSIYFLALKEKKSTSLLWQALGRPAGSSLPGSVSVLCGVDFYLFFGPIIRYARTVKIYTYTFP